MIYPVPSIYYSSKPVIELFTFGGCKWVLVIIEVLVFISIGDWVEVVDIGEKIL